MSFRFKCEIDGCVFIAEPQPYPNKHVQTRCFSPKGDTQIVCPRCRKAYIHHDASASWVSSRPLTVLEGVS